MSFFGVFLGIVCKIPLLARRTRPSARATIGYLVYNFGDRMANLGLIDFKIGLYSEVNLNHGQNEFEIHI